jgi:hypothetical protein
MRKLEWSSKGGVAAVLGMVAVAITLSGVPAGRAQQPTQAKARPIPAPVVDASGLMKLFNKPLYTHLQAAMEQKPADNKAWATIEERGLQTAEVANLVALRQAKPPQEEWAHLAGNLQRAGLVLADAAKAKDWNATIQAYEGVIQRCNECHETRSPGKAPMLKP